MAQGITVRDVSIYDCARSGINISEGTWGRHLIEGCDVFDTVLETHDHGSFNSWGRDRFWHLKNAPAEKLPEIALLDATKTSVIRNSRWRCDHGWDIDLDDGSSNYDIYNNLMLASGLKLREGFRRHAWNNIMVNNGLHPHVWYLGNGDEVHGNILMSRHRPARMKRPNADAARVDKNLFYVANETPVKVTSKTLGWDENSIFGNAQFIDPAKGDFTVTDNSPALKIGFKNFPMDQFGVKKPSLKKIARTPNLPTVKNQSEPQPQKRAPLTDSSQTIWFGASIQTLAGEEFSAYGVSKDDGGVVLIEVPTNSEAARHGFQEGDVIQQINGKATPTIKALLQTYLRAGNKALKIKFVRQQQAQEIIIKNQPWIDLESAKNTQGFKQTPSPKAHQFALSANIKTNNDPLTSLSDGQLVRSYGPVFANGSKNTAYKLDLGKVRSLKAINTWSCDLGKRGAQNFTLYGSSANNDPGWDTTKLTALATIDTRAFKGSSFNASSLKAAHGKSLGKFRWIMWKVSPISKKGGGEHSAFQELSVEYLEGH